MEWRAAQVEVTDPDSLLMSQPFSGTHSVIDMTRVAEQPGFNAVSPVPAEQLMELFGTTRPTIGAVEAAVAAHTVDGFERWQGVYLVGYAADRPAEIFFVGCSGD